MMKTLNPDNIHPPFAAYSHGVCADASQLLVSSGQLGIAKDGSIPERTEAQADLCLEAIDAILAEGGMDRRNIVRLNAYVTDRAHMAGYMRARDRYMASLAQKPASTLMIVSGFTKPEFKVEIEVMAAK